MLIELLHGGSLELAQADLIFRVIMRLVAYVMHDYLHIWKRGTNRTQRGLFAQPTS